MPGFKYQAYTDAGKLQAGVLEADSARAARAALRTQGLTPYRVEVISSASAPRLGLPGRRARLSGLEVTRVTRSLATLLDAGLTVQTACDALIAQAASAREKAVLAAIRSEVMAGQSLAAALASSAASFDDLYRTLVQAGETAGQLPAVLARLADHLESRQSLAARIGVALIYPLLVLLVSVAVIGALLTYVVPQVVQVFAASKASLPWLTQVLIATAALLRNWGWLLLAVAVMLALVAWRLLRRPGAAARAQGALLRLPGIGRLLRSLDAARLASTLSILVGSGVPLLAALVAAQGVLTLRPLRAALTLVTEAVKGGQSLAAAMAATGAFPPVLVHLVQSGESTGRLDHALARAASEQEAQALTRISALTALIEPLIILGVGLLVLGIVLAVLLPIFELNRLLVR
jgi:general secretion pathway protein F